MAKFLYGTELNLRIEEMIANAEEFLFLVSPYIKLHDRIKDELKRKKLNDKLEIIIVFGKNEDDRSKSLCTDDLKFLTDFPNIKICYEKHLHAKYYASENASLITSMNLHQYSHNTNVEVGVEMYPKSIVASIASTLKSSRDCDEESVGYFQEVIDNSLHLFVKTPQYEPGIFKRGKYTNSVVELDHLHEFFNYKSIASNNFNQSVKAGASSDSNTNFAPGYCIRTGIKIPFNPTRPLSDEAFKIWSKYNDSTFHEAYCHYSGEPSLGETSYAVPILKKNLARANQLTF